MSLDVADDLAADVAAHGITDHKFVDVIRTSLPFGYAIIERVAARVSGGEEVAIDSPPTMADTPRLELLRIMASTSMREALERFFGVTLAFQNCHGVAAASGSGKTSRLWHDFTSTRGQILAQRPGLRDC